MVLYVSRRVNETPEGRGVFLIERDKEGACNAISGEEATVAFYIKDERIRDRVNE